MVPGTKYPRFASALFLIVALRTAVPALPSLGQGPTRIDRSRLAIRATAIAGLLLAIAVGWFLVAQLMLPNARLHADSALPFKGLSPFAHETRQAAFFLVLAVRVAAERVRSIFDVNR
jgi:hypothetical protein